MNVLNGLKLIAIYGAAIGVTALGIGAINNKVNNKEIHRRNYSEYSIAQGIVGSTVYTKYNFLQTVRIRSNFMWEESKFYEDSNGDGLVDTILQGEEYLNREWDYYTNKDRFDEADNTLKELVLKYSE